MPGLDIIKLAAGVFLTCILIAVAFSLTNSGRDVYGGYSEQMASTAAKVSESDKVRYDGTIVSGADVINAVRGNSNDMQIKVTTIKNLEQEEVEKVYSALSTFTNLPSDEGYVNPYAKFLGEIDRTENGVICGINFSQQAYVDNAVAQGGNSTVVDGGDSGGGVDTLADSLNSMLGQLGTIVQALNASISELSSNSGGVNTGGTNVEVDMSGVSNTLLQIVEILTEMNGGITNMAGAESVSMTDLQTAILALQNNIKELKEQAEESNTGGGDSVDLTTITSSLTTLQNAISSISEQLSELVVKVAGDGTEVDKGMAGDVATIQTTLDKLRNTIDEMQKKLSEISENVGGTP